VTMITRCIIFCTGNGSSNSRYGTFFKNLVCAFSQHNILYCITFTISISHHGSWFIMKLAAGQKLGKLGEEYSLNFEKFPNVGLLKVSRQSFSLRKNPHQIV